MPGFFRKVLMDYNESKAMLAKGGNALNIHIIGGGAIGLFLAAEWSREHKVTVQTRTAEQKKVLESKGIQVKEKEKETVSFVSVAEKAPPGTQLLVVAVKQYQLAALLPEIPAVPSVLFIQNGLSHFKQMKTLPHKHIYAASVEHGIAKEDLRTVQVNGRSQIKLAAVKAGTKKLAGCLQTELFPVKWTEDVYSMLVDKLAANAVINPLTAILEVENGSLAKNECYRSVLEALCAEFSVVFSYKTKEEVTRSVLEICRKTADNESSMLKDIKAGRPTELETIVGVLLEEAARKKVAVPAFQVLYHLINGKTNERIGK